MDALRPVEGGRRGSDLEGATRIAATIRSGAATGSIPAIGMAAASSSTSPTWRIPNLSLQIDGIGARSSCGPPIRPCSIDRTIAGRRYMLVADEDVQPMDPAMAPEMSAFIWSVDITDEKHPVPVCTFQVEGVEGHQNPEMTGCHQPVELITIDGATRKSPCVAVLERAARAGCGEPALRCGAGRTCAGLQKGARLSNDVTAGR